MNGPTTSDEASGEREYRARLLEAALSGIGEVGWANLTIAEIVRRARVSKRTFYEHFATKDACLLGLYEEMSSLLLDELESASRLVPRGEVRIEAGARFYLQRLAEKPRVVRTLAIEILHLGAEGLALRRRVMRRFATFLRREINAMIEGPPVSMALVMIIVGGINELTLEAFEEDRMDRLDELVEPIAQLVRSVVAAAAARRTEGSTGRGQAGGRRGRPRRGRLP